MCLLIVLSRLDSDTPLLMAANRDERLDRDAVVATVLVPDGPRVLGGRDGLAGGTWLAVNEYGLVVGLTNRPSPGGRDPAKRSRGELPLALAQHKDATSAVEEFAVRFRADDYNPAWLLVGDRRSLFYLEMGGQGAPEVQRLPPGLFVLANGPLGEASPKTDHVRRRLETIADLAEADRIHLLESVLSDHSIPPGAEALVTETRPIQLSAACVHTEGYGTRSAALVRVPAQGLPRVAVVDGPPCRAPFTAIDELWSIDVVPVPEG